MGPELVPTKSAGIAEGKAAIHAEQFLIAAAVSIHALARAQMRFADGSLEEGAHQGPPSARVGSPKGLPPGRTLTRVPQAIQLGTKHALHELQVLAEL